MQPETVFAICTYGVLPAWWLLILAPGWRWTHRLVHAVWVPSLIALGFGWGFLTNPAWPSGASFLTLRGVMALSESPHLALAGWLHATAFDIFVGAWEVRDAERLGIRHLWVVPCLLLSMTLGPLGLVLYFFIRYALRRRITLAELPSVEDRPNPPAIS